MFFISLDQLSAKKIVLEEKLKSLTGNENKRKRLNIFKSLGKINKAIEDPQHFMKDPKGEKVKKDLDNMRRVTKKIEKKKLILLDKRRDRNRERSLLCLYCKKCKQITFLTNRRTLLDQLHGEGGDPEDQHVLQLRGDRPRTGRLSQTPGRKTGFRSLLYLQGTRPRKLRNNPSLPRTALRTPTACTSREEAATSADVCFLMVLLLANMHVKRDCPERKKKSEQNAIEKE